MRAQSRGRNQEGAIKRTQSKGRNQKDAIKRAQCLAPLQECKMAVPYLIEKRYIVYCN